MKSLENLVKATSDTTRSIGTGIFDFSRMFGKTYYIFMLPYILPTARRQNKEGSIDVDLNGAYIPYRNPERPTSLEDSAGILGGTAGVASLLGSFFGGIIYSVERPEILAVPIATNLLSALYEGGRKAYKNFHNSGTSIP